MRTVYDLMARVADHLTGKSVRLRMVRPDGYDGLAWCDELGVSTIDVSPGLSDETMLYVLLHEIAHIRHHTFRPLSETVVVSTPEDEASPSYMIRELQADSQAYAWLDYGKRHRDQTLPYLEGVLWSLLTIDTEDG